MRIKIEFSGFENVVLPRDHYYLLAGMVYKMIETSNMDYSRWLHDYGFTDDSKKFKFFNFSRLFSKDYVYTGEKKNNMLFKSDKAWMYISSPIEEFMKYLIDYILILNTVKIGRNKIKIDIARGMVQNKFSNEETFKVITPILLTKKVEEYNKPFFIRAYQDPEEFDEYLKRNLVEKIKIKRELDPNIEVACDKEYIKRKNKLTACRINIIRNESVIGNILPIKIKGDPKTIAFIYDTGLGKSNSLGLGMIEQVGKRH